MWPYFIADWEHWLGDWEHLQPMTQQLPSFLLFGCCDENSMHTILKPSYVSEYIAELQIRILYKGFDCSTQIE